MKAETMFFSKTKKKENLSLMAFATALQYKTNILARHIDLSQQIFIYIYQEIFLGVSSCLKKKLL